MNQDPIPSPPPPPAQEVIEILSSDPDTTPQSPQPPPSPPNVTQVAPERANSPAHARENLDFPALLPPQDSTSPPAQPPPASSPHEAEDMMNISEEMEDTHTVDNPQTIPTPPLEDPIIQSFQSEDELPPLPPPSSSSPSCHIHISRGPTPTVRHLLYGGPNGIFRDANLSLLQHMQGRSSQDIPLTPPIPEPALGPVTPPVSNVVFSILTTF